MKKKILWLLVGSLMALSLVLASCAPAVTEEEEVVTEEEEVVAEEVVTEEEEAPTGPQYGGWITVTTDGTGSFMVSGYRPTALDYIAHYLIYEPLAIPDWSRGPSGTNEISFISSYTPEEFHTGCLAESWEIPDLKTYIFHLRKGVRWQNKPPANGRELTADDVVWSLTILGEAPGPAFPIETTKFTAVDKYTVRIELDDPDPNAFWNVNYHHFVFPPEMGDSADWRDACGTGPFILTDFVSASSATVERNPDFWQEDPLHPGNRLPYVDGITELYIADPATRLAALRTGKVDRIVNIPWQQAESLKGSNPELLFRRGQGSISGIVVLRIDLEPLSDITVRRALALAIDNQAIVKDYFKGNADLISWPVMPDATGIYTPFDELPESQREIFEYKPEKARQLLAEAGYPNGFTMDAMVSYWPGYSELFSIVMSYWEEIGVRAEPRYPDVASFWSIMMGTRGYECALSTYGNSNPYNFFNRFYRPPHSLNWFWKDSETFKNDYLAEAREKINSTLDPVERAEMIKELNLYIMDLLYVISLPMENNYVVWQPWLKGYHGEAGMGHVWSTEGMYRYVWVDQDLKASVLGAE